MTESALERAPRPDEGLSLLALVRIGLAHRVRILRWAVIGGVVAVTPFLLQRLEYTSVASFTPQGVSSASSLSGIAGQFGLAVGGSEPAQSLDFYSDLLRSRALLDPILDLQVEVGEGSGVVIRTVQGLLEVEDPDSALARLKAYEALSRAIGISVMSRSGVLRFDVTTQSPRASAAIADEILRALNSFNLETRRSQARAEREFFDARLTEMRDSLEAAEVRLQQFLASNRSFSETSEASLDFQRLQRQVAHYQGIVTALATSFEEARAREVRSTPVITVIEEPTVPPRPNPRGRVRKGLTGVVLGGLFGLLLGWLVEGLDVRRRAGDPEVEALDRAFTDALRLFRRS